MAAPKKSAGKTVPPVYNPKVKGKLQGNQPGGRNTSGANPYRFVEEPKTKYTGPYKASTRVKSSGNIGPHTGTPAGGYAQSGPTPSANYKEKWNKRQASMKTYNAKASAKQSGSSKTKKK